jgi:type I restriction enzyme, R subunit
LYFNILDYTGSATRLFADPDFDGELAWLSEEQMNALGETIGEPEVITEEEGGQVIVDEPSPEPPPEDTGEQPRRKYYVNAGHIGIAAHVVHELDADGKQLRVVTLTDYTAEKVRSMYPSAAELRSKWSNAQERAAIIDSLQQHGISLEELIEASKQPDADPFDVLCNVAFSAPLRTRRERAENLRRDRKDFFERYSEPARRC